MCFGLIITSPVLTAVTNGADLNFGSISLVSGAVTDGGKLHFGTI